MVYEGNEKYIFVSYAHKDAETVLPIVEALNNDGYRVWYDSGIEAGTEWPEYIEEHLLNAHVVLVFMSPAAIDSRNCRNEINFALELKKEILVVYLEETALLKGMRLQLNSTQSLFRMHHDSEETFVQELLCARILKDCHPVRSAATRPKPTAPVAATPTMPMAQPSAPKRLGWPILAAAGVALVAVLVAVIVLIGGRGNDKPTPTDGTTTTATTKAEEGAETPVTMSDDWMDFTAEIEGVVYELPCEYEKFASAGWAILASQGDESTRIAGGDTEVFTMSYKGKEMDVTFYNPSGNATALKDCYISGVTASVESKVEMKLAKGLTPASTIDEIIAAYGSPNDRSEHSDFVSLYYQVDGSWESGIVFMIYTDGTYTDWSSVTVENRVMAEKVKTETNTEKPAYLAQYQAPSALGSDIKSGVVKIDGDLYQLPAPVDTFLQNGWEIAQQPTYVVSGASDSMRLKRDGKEMYIYISNFAEYQTTPENCAVYSAMIDADGDVDMELPGGIHLGMTKAEVEAILSDEFRYYDGEGAYDDSWSYAEYDEREFSINIDIDVDDATVNAITVRSETWNYGT